ncbi:MAG: sigma-70 family RNA polymerase sigma factor [Planctomycetes bacterium]|nr:sigma-70 family RNA polymerase sigma factor [Planctomycetota bacterium]
MDPERLARRDVDDGGFAVRLRAAKAGDRVALDALLRAVQSWVRREAEHSMSDPTRSRARPSDVAQDALVQIVNRLATFEGESEAQFFAWVRTIVENTARRAARFFAAQKRRPPSRTSQLRALADELVPESRSPSTELERAEGIALLHRALESLREDHRMILEQVALRGRPVVEVAAELGRPAASTRMLLSRARTALTDALVRQGRGDLLG